MSEDKLYELRQDINTPAHYIRAGKRATEAQWKERLGDFNIRWCSEWFLDTTVKEEQMEVDELNDLVDAVFKERGLRSISYKEAARLVAELWLKQNQTK
jgi:hypothetical protein